MRGQMMELPLTITSILRHAETNHPRREIVSVAADRSVHRYGYADAFRRARRFANALKHLGVHQGDRVGTLAWNHFRHFEAYFAVSCYGAVLHTVNPRLFPEQISYIINHAADRILLIDPEFVGLVESIRPHLKSVESFVVLCEPARMPATSLPDAKCYETLLDAEPDQYQWPDLDEHAASSMCYTSGTTGNPKGVVYSHRATVLHSYGTALSDAMGLRARDCVLPLVPMFHVNAWGTPYTAAMVGAKVVLPGPLAGNSAVVCDLVHREQVTIALGVPTVWLGMLDHLQRGGQPLPADLRIIVGGAACPAVVFDAFGASDVEVLHAWGMTELSPLGTFNAPSANSADPASADERQRQLKQGRALFGVEMKIVDDADQELPWDGVSSGRLKVRGPWVCSGYYLPDEGVQSHDAQGWFETGDVATIDADGFMHITDRTKDLIKSGGEWISSIVLENLAQGHPAVAEAAVIGMPHPKWSERPLLVVVAKAGQQPDRTELLAWYEGKVAKWWIPDDVAFVAELPHTATGKVSKVRLRAQFAHPDGGGPAKT